MPVLCDTNVLLACCYDRHVHHRPALAWLDGQAARAVVLCRVTQTSLLRLLSTSAVMGADVCTLAGAWSVYDALLNDERFRFLDEPKTLEGELRRFTSAPIVAPKLWTDAYLAAFALSSGLHLVTFDGGFRQFAALQLVLL